MAYCFYPESKQILIEHWALLSLLKTLCGIQKHYVMWTPVFEEVKSIAGKIENTHKRYAKNSKSEINDPDMIWGRTRMQISCPDNIFPLHCTSSYYSYLYSYYLFIYLITYCFLHYPFQIGMNWIAMIGEIFDIMGIC